MKNLFLTLCLIILASYSYAQKTISVLSGTTWTFYEDFSTALRQAPSGATIYLPGGLFTIQDGSDTITKPLTIIGVGHFPDSTQATLPTIINGLIWLSQGSDNSSFIGFDIINGGIQIPNWGNNITVSNINISRCKLSSFGFIWIPSNNKIKNILVSECIITGDIGGYMTEPLNIVFEKSILDEIYDLEDVTFRNNFIFRVGVNTDHPLRNCTFDNNIINSNYYMISCIARNNIFFSDFIYSQLLSINNIFSGTFDNTFVNVLSPIYDDSYNYHLKSSSAGKNMGTDGTDVGIYGTSKPCKDGWVPPNPHITFKSIPSESLPNGTLPVNVKVVAQDR